MASQRDDCLFCKLYREGDHVASAKGLVAIKDINPQAPVHLLVIPEQHIETFRDVGELSGGDSHRMLEFIADTARNAGLEDYKVQVNVGPHRRADRVPPPLAHPRPQATEAPGLADTTAVSEL